MPPPSNTYIVLKALVVIGVTIRCSWACLRVSFWEYHLEFSEMKTEAKGTI